MVTTLLRIGRYIRQRTVDETVSNGVEHRLVLGHRIDNAFRVLRSAERQKIGPASVYIGRARLATQAMERVLAVMYRPVLA